MIMNSAKNGSWIFPFKKFGMVRVKTEFKKGKYNFYVEQQFGY